MKKRSTLFSPFGITQLLMIAAIGTALWLAYEPWQWGRLKEEVRRHSPSIGKISTDELAKWLADKSVEQPRIIDARQAEEYHASHLPGASQATLTLAELGIEGKLKTPIVVYCTVGFDSAATADSFKKRGFERVQIIEGGIFLWANENRKLVNASGSVTKVLPGKSPYASMLHRSLRAE
jgi:rhodanese-related sulfurtransferase